jgi:hypothetical protein
MTDRIIRVLAGAALVGFTAVAMAQQSPAPAAASSAPAPRHTCTKPGEYPGNLASDNQKRSWQKGYVDYVDCLKKFIDEQRALAEPHVKASNDAINEYNDGVKAYNAQVEKAKSN